MIYWHVEKGRVCLYSQAKTCSASEVASMIEGLLRHLTSAEIERQYTDTHGASLIGHAFSHLLGFKLLPRDKTLSWSRLYRPEPGSLDAWPQLSDLGAGLLGHLPHQRPGQRLAVLDLPVRQALPPRAVGVMVEQQDSALLDADSGHTGMHRLTIAVRTDHDGTARH